MTHRRQRVAGVSLVEALVALVLGVFVAHLGFAALTRLDRAVAAAHRRGDVALTSRIARAVLSAELAMGQRGRDWWVGSDTIALRAFRGVGVVCPGSVAGRDVLVAYSGSRAPDPQKDSLEVISADGSIIVVGLAGVGASVTSCLTAAAAEAVQRWVADSDLPAAAVLLRPFERGSYHLSGSAVRYRAGGGGRQPITPEVLRDAASGWVDSAGAVSVRLTPADGSRSWRGVVWRGRR